MRNISLLPVMGLSAFILFLAGCPKPPAAPERPWGPGSATRNTPVACSTRMSDPESGDVEFQFDWGDGSQSEWSGPQPGGAAFGATHTYSITGRFSVRARARVGRSRPSEWSEDFILRVEVGEGELFHRFGFLDPDDEFGEDSADFSSNTFALGPDGRSYVGCELALLFRNPEGRRDKEFLTRDFDGFFPAPTLGDNGQLYIVCENESLYAFNINGTRRWVRPLGDEVLATAALGADGTIYVHSVSESLYAFGSDGTRRWTFPAGGNSSPVIGPDGTVFVCSDEGVIAALDPASGTLKNSYTLGDNAVTASPALDPGRNRLYVADEEGRLVALNTLTFALDWDDRVGEEPSSPVIGTDGTVYIGGGGNLHALDPETGISRWTFRPPLSGVVSTPAISDQGRIYALVSGGRRKDGRRPGRTRAWFDPDTLYAVSLEGERRWAVGLGEGFVDEIMSAPKIDPAGYIYVGNGFSAWIVRGLGGPAPSPWPMFQRDGQNTGRAR